MTYYPCWQPGVPYAAGSVVEFQGRRYRLLQPHTSQSDWAPSVAHSLWAVHQDEHHHSHSQYPGAPPAYTAAPVVAPVQTYGPPVAWEVAQNGYIPPRAIPGGYDHEGKPIFVARVFYNNEYHVGKIMQGWRGANFSYGGDELSGIANYEVLVGDAARVRWVDCVGRVSFNSLKGELVEGGRLQNGTQMFVGQASYERGVHPGKVPADASGIFIGWGGREFLLNNYRVLVV